MKPALLATLALALATPAAAAAPWRPTGVAVSVTGPIALTPGHFVAAGADFPLRLVGQASTLQSGRRVREALIFAVDRAMTPPLVNGARLCGLTPPTWIVAVPIAPAGLEIAVFNGETRPSAPDSRGLCATFFYNR
jgi:hypothetical protein